MASNSKHEFLRFSAYSFKDMITRKMSEDSKFTDQIYEGSNLAILIDLCAYLYQCLVYQLNSAASESMFADTQFYENINRLVKLIGYNPRGCRPSEIVMFIDNEDARLSNKAILPFSYVDTGLSDGDGRRICFSTDFAGQNDDNVDYINDERYHKVRLYNGRWHMYSQVLVSGGAENESFTLDGLKSDSENGRYVAFEHIKVFVERAKDGAYETEWYADTENIFTGISHNDGVSSESDLKKVFNKQEKVYSVRLNENKVYEIKFGDGVVGQKLDSGDKLYVFYLETNGAGGNVDLLDLPDNMKFKNSPSDFDISKTLYESIICKPPTTPLSEDDEYSYSFGDSVVQAQDEESVESIRENAPSWFNTGNRLITKADYEYWVKSNVNGVIDVKCMNNWQYLTTFYRWLYEYAVKYHSDPAYYLNKDRITRYNCKFVDAADANNVYLWVKSQYDADSMGSQIQKACQNIKTMTAEIAALQPVTVYFDICAVPQGDVASVYPVRNEFGKNQDGEYESYIEITLDDSVMYVNSDMKQAVVDAFKQYFDRRNCVIGQLVDYSTVLRGIYALNGVQNVRTVFVHNGDTFNARAVNGLSMASWSDGIIEYGEDMHVSNISRQLEDFQFPSLFDEESILSKIKIVKKQLTNINTIKY